MTSEIPKKSAISWGPLEKPAVIPNRLRVLSLIVEDHPGVLERVASQVRRRGFNIAALSVGPVSEGRSRMTVTVDAGHAEVDQVAKQVDKLIEVIDVHDLTDEPLIARELVVARLVVDAGARDAAVAAVAQAGGRVVDTVNGSIIVEFTTEPARIEELLTILRPLGLSELARSGPVAMRRTPLK
jgi:acetolactate synthase I/III small subunit